MSIAGNYAENAAPGAVAPGGGVFDQIVFDNAFNPNVPIFLTPVADAALVGNLGSLALFGNFDGALTVSRNLTVANMTTMK